MTLPVWLSIAGAVAIGASIAANMILDEPEQRDADGKPELYPSVVQKVASGPAVLVVMFLGIAIYLAIRYLPIWP
jgi:hypothetical protein